MKLPAFITRITDARKRNAEKAAQRGHLHAGKTHFHIVDDFGHWELRITIKGEYIIALDHQDAKHLATTLSACHLWPTVKRAAMIVPDQYDSANLFQCVSTSDRDKPARINIYTDGGTGSDDLGKNDAMAIADFIWGAK